MQCHNPHTRKEEENDEVNEGGDQTDDVGRVDVENAEHDIDESEDEWV